MLIHFAFGSLGKQGKTGEQTERVVECILKEKRLKISKCKEFIPAFPDPNRKPIPLKLFKAVKGRTDLVVAEIDGNRLADTASIRYLPFDVPMVCFIKITFSQLKNSTHAREYGKVGIVLTNDSLKAKGIRYVNYYTEESLYTDPLILKWNHDCANGKLSGAETRELQKEITAYRKPANLFPSFGKSGIHEIHFGAGEPQTDYFTYNRYPEGYDFTKEKEHRIVFDEGLDYLDFEEKDLFMVITPDPKVQCRIQDFFSQHWKEKPRVTIYPS